MTSCNCAPEKNQYAWVFFAIGAVLIVALLAFAVYSNAMKRRSQLLGLYKSRRRRTLRRQWYTEVY